MKYLLIIFFFLTSYLYSQNLVFENDEEVLLTDSTGTIYLKIISQDEPNGIEYAFITLENIKLTYFTRDTNAIIINDLLPGKYPVKYKAAGYSEVRDTIIVFKNDLTKLIVTIPSEEELYEKKADADIKNGNIELLQGGLVAFCTSLENVNHIASKYGFQYKLMGCSFRAGKKYNEKMYRYLSELNGDNW